MMTRLKNKAKISVVMSVFNGERYLHQAIKSILDQSLEDFEFLIINDGSTDRSIDIIKSFKDSRVRIFNQKNKGLVFSLNRGLKEARTDLIARMDADDISFPTRLEKQLEFLNENPSVGLIGTTTQVFYEDGSLGHVNTVLTEDEDIRKAFLITNMIVHGSVMFRRELLKNTGYYDKKALHVEDYDLWIRFGKVTKVGNLPDLLYAWRVNYSGLSYNYSKIQSETTDKVIDNYRQEIINSKHLLQTSISYSLSRKRFYLSRKDPYKKQRIAILSSISVKHARYLLGQGKYKDSISELVSAILLSPLRVSTYLFMPTLLLGEGMGAKLEYFIKKLIRKRKVSSRFK